MMSGCIAFKAVFHGPTEDLLVLVATGLFAPCVMMLLLSLPAMHDPSR